MSVFKASSVYNDDNGSWGPHLALTEASTSNTGYWHSKTGDKNPSIEFKMSGSKEVFSVQIVDRLNGFADRFEQVEVRVGSSSSYDSATSCGTQSYSGSTSYNYICPSNTVGQHVFIKKHGTTEDYLQINHVTVMEKGNCS